MARPNYYAVLGVHRDASTDDIKRSYRRLALECHPDRFPGDEVAAQRFREVSDAYAVLGDPSKRARYDAEGLLPDTIDLGVVGAGAARAVDRIGNAVSELLGTARKERLKGRDVLSTMSISFEQAVLGTTKTIELEANAACKRCEGTGTRPGGRPPITCTICNGRGSVRDGGILARTTRCGRCDGAGVVRVDACEVCQGRGMQRGLQRYDVTVPPGTVGGARRELAGLGEPGRFGGEPGSLVVTIDVRPHPFLERKDDEIRCKLPLSPFELMLGTRADVPTVDGWVEVDVPRGVQPGTRLRLRGRGLVTPKGRGDMFIDIEVEWPSGPPSGPSDEDEQLSAGLRAAEALVSARPQLLPRRSALRSAASAALQKPGETSSDSKTQSGASATPPTAERGAGHPGERER